MPVDSSCESQVVERKCQRLWVETMGASGWLERPSAAGLHISSRRGVLREGGNYEGTLAVTNEFLLPIFKFDYFTFPVSRHYRHLRLDKILIIEWEEETTDIYSGGLYFWKVELASVKTWKQWPMLLMCTYLIALGSDCLNHFLKSSPSSSVYSLISIIIVTTPLAATIGKL